MFVKRFSNKVCFSDRPTDRRQTRHVLWLDTMIGKVMSKSCGKKHAQIRHEVFNKEYDAPECRQCGNVHEYNSLKVCNNFMFLLIVIRRATRLFKALENISINWISDIRRSIYLQLSRKVVNLLTYHRWYQKGNILKVR